MGHPSPMDSLRSYLNSMPVADQERFAGEVGTTVGYLRKACSVRPRIGADLAIRMELASNGRVLAEDLRPDVPWRQWLTYRGRAA